MRTLILIAALALTACATPPPRTDMTVEVIADTEIRDAVCQTLWPQARACYVGGTIYLKSSEVLSYATRIYIPTDLFIPAPGGDKGIAEKCGVALAAFNNIDLRSEPVIAESLCHEAGHAIGYTH